MSIDFAKLAAIVAKLDASESGHGCEWAPIGGNDRQAIYEALTAAQALQERVEQALRVIDGPDDAIVCRFLIEALLRPDVGARRITWQRN